MKPGQPLEIEYYTTHDGVIPFQLWFDKLQDKAAQARILIRLERLSTGNPGDYKGIGMEDAYELRITHGKGYRVYFGVRKNILVVLLCGGNKATQTNDIAMAQSYWAEYRQRFPDDE